MLEVFAMRKELFYLLLIPFLFGCNKKGEVSHIDSDISSEQSETSNIESSSSGEEVTGPQYFKQFKDQVDANPNGEFEFLKLYDKDGNRFNVTFIYEDHMGYILHIEEYDLDNVYINPVDGQFSDDYESIAFTNTSHVKSTLFKDGRYVLKHILVDEADTFVLETPITGTYSLTSQAKPAPKYINSDLVGEFEYIKSEVIQFSITVTVSSRETGYIPTIALKEGDVDYSTSNVTIGTDEVTFSITGSASGTYILLNATYKMTASSAGAVKVLINSTSYSLTKKEKEKPEDNRYFVVANVILSNSEIKIELGNIVGDNERRFAFMTELGEGGKGRFQGLYLISEDGNTLTSAQNFSGILVFTSGSTFVIQHSVVNGQDKVDFYKDGTLLFENLTITPIEQ